MRPYLTPEERFWKYVHKTETCWLWTGTKSRGGYGAFRVGRKSVSAHRFSYELHYGPIPHGMQCLHRCDRPACIAPSHLWLGSIQDNIADKVKKGRQAFGSRIHRTKLTETDIPVIRQLLAEGGSPAAIGKMFNVSHTPIYQIKHGETWKHVT